MKFCDEISKHKLKKLGNERPFLKDVTVVEVRRGSENLFIKKCFLDESFCEYNLMNTSFSKTFIPNSVGPNRGIPPGKNNK